MNSRTNYSNFWFDRQTSLVDDFLADDDAEMSKSNQRKITSNCPANQRAIGNFVRIVSGKNIPVRYMTRGDSYTDGKSVTIAGNIKPETFDQTVGLGPFTRVVILPTLISRLVTMPSTPCILIEVMISKISSRIW